MALDFPSSPTVGQVFTVSNATWAWDGTKWTANGTPVVATGDNRIINGNFAVNQRGFVSGTALPSSPTVANGYGHDRWKAGASGCTYTFTATLPDTTITITANTLTQIIEAGMIEGGVYTLSWTGTAQARVYQGTPTGSYAASPITTASLTAGTNTIVEFNTGTLTKVKFEIGSVATSFNRLSLARSLVDCQRYYNDPQNGAASPIAYQIGFSAVAAATYTGQTLYMPVTMRATPTVTPRNQSFGGVATAVALTPISTQTVLTTVTTNAAGNVNAAFNMTANAEL